MSLTPWWTAGRQTGFDTRTGPQGRSGTGTRRYGLCAISVRTAGIHASPSARTGRSTSAWLVPRGASRQVKRTRASNDALGSAYTPCWWASFCSSYVSVRQLPSH